MKGMRESEIPILIKYLLGEFLWGKVELLIPIPFLPKGRGRHGFY